MLKNDDKSDKNALIQNEIQWLQSISSRCELSANSPSLKSLNCTRILFEFRFAALDTCAQGGEKVTDCLKSQVDADYVLEDRADLEASLEEANRKAQEDPDPVHRAQLVKIRNEWQQFVAANCDLGEVGDTPTQLARACASDAIVVRILQLRACTNRLPKDQIPCLSDFRLFEKWPIVIYSKVK